MKTLGFILVGLGVLLIIVSIVIKNGKPMFHALVGDGDEETEEDFDVNKKA